MFCKCMIITLLLLCNMQISSVAVSSINSKTITPSIPANQLKTKTVRLHLVRHGETVANRNGVLQGHCDYPLTSDGLEQADACGYYLRDINWDKVYASDLQRAYHTCQYILAKSTYPKFKKVQAIQKEPLLREHNFGVREALPRSTPYEEAVRLTAERLGIPEDEVIDTTESYETVMARQRVFIASLLNDVALVRENNDEIYEPKVEVKDNRRAAPKGTPPTPTNYDLSSHIRPDTSDDTEEESNKRLNVLCLTHGHYVKTFLKNFCHAEVPAKIHNCGLTIVDVNWTDPTDDNSYTVKIEDHWVNINTWEYIMAGKGASY